MITIDWNAFTPASALAGRGLIGLGVAVLLLVNGRIAGISGIIGGLLPFERGNILWRLVLLAGIFLAPVLYGSLHVLPESRIDAGYATLVAAGLLVGFGTRLGYSSAKGLVFVIAMLAGMWLFSLVEQYRQS